MNKTMPILFTLLIFVSIGSNYFLYNKIERVKSLSTLSLYGTYCNAYRRDSIDHFIQNNNWGEYVMFPDVCNIQYALDRIDAVKYRNDKPQDNKFIHNYDSFYTGANNKFMSDIHGKHYKKLVEKYKKLLEE